MSEAFMAWGATPDIMVACDNYLYAISPIDDDAC